MNVHVETAAPQHLNSQEITWSEKHRTLVIGKRAIDLTRTEYRLLFPLRSGKPVSYAGLADIVYKCQFDLNVRTMLDKHIDRIRGKLRGSGVYIYCILGYGYVLLPEPGE
jgi:DNA-binding response OmpR family regulator